MAKDPEIPQMGKNAPSVADVIAEMKTHREADKAAAKQRTREKSWQWIWYAERIGVLVEVHGLHGEALQRAGRQAGFGKSDTYRLNDLSRCLDTARAVLAAGERDPKFKWPGLQKLLALASDVSPTGEIDWDDKRADALNRLRHVMTKRGEFDQSDPPSLYDLEDIVAAGLVAWRAGYTADDLTLGFLTLSHGEDGDDESS